MANYCFKVHRKLKYFNYFHILSVRLSGFQVDPPVLTVHPQNLILNLKASKILIKKNDFSLQFNTISI